MASVLYSSSRMKIPNLRRPRSLLITDITWERSGRVLDSRPRDRGFDHHRRNCVVSLSKNINPSLVLVQPRKPRPFITGRLLMGRIVLFTSTLNIRMSKLQPSQHYNMFLIAQATNHALLKDPHNPPNLSQLKIYARV